MIRSILVLLALVSPILSTPLTQGPSQPLTQDASTPLTLAALSSAPLFHPNRTSLSTPDNALGCFKDRPWPPAHKEDCEAALDYWVAGESLNTPRLFSQKVATAHMARVRLPFKAYSGTCQIWINVLDEEHEVVLDLADVYAQVLGPDGSAKNCLGQTGLPAIGGRMALGRDGWLSVSISGLKQPVNKPGVASA